MGSIWTVNPDTVRVSLSFNDHEFWIDLKKELTAGEEKKLHAAGFKSWSKPSGGEDVDDLELNVNWDTMIFAKVKTYLAGWSLTDDKDRKLPLDLDTIRALHSDVFKLIENAIDEHVKTKELLEKKVETSAAPTSDIKLQEKIS